MSKEVKRYYVQLWRMEEAKFAPGPLGACEMVKASDYEALLAERDAIAEQLTEERMVSSGMIDLYRDSCEERDALAKDAERLDRLDMECEAYGCEGIHEGNRWMIDGPFRTVREAIDAALQGEQP